MNGVAQYGGAFYGQIHYGDDTYVSAGSSVINISVSDTLSLSDTDVVGSRLPLAVIQDFISLTDKITLSAQFFLSQNDSLSLTDLIALILAPIANLNLTDSVALSDAVAAQLNSIFVALNVSVSDALSLLDALNLSGPTLSFSDSLVLSDSVCVVLQSTLRAYTRRYLNDVV